MVYMCLIMCIYPFNLIDKFNIPLFLSPDNLIIIGNYLIDKLNSNIILVIIFIYNLVLSHFCQWVTGFHFLNFPYIFLTYIHYVM